jgi:hypothetical protein
MEQGHHTRLLPLELNALSKYTSHFISQDQQWYNVDDDDDNEDDDDVDHNNINKNAIPINFQNWECHTLHKVYL